MSRSIPASEVLRVGTESLLSATKLPPLPPPRQIGGFGVVQIPLEQMPDVRGPGVTRLIDSNTGECVGIFASPEVAKRTQDFFA